MKRVSIILKITALVLLFILCGINFCFADAYVPGPNPLREKEYNPLDNKTLVLIGIILIIIVIAIIVAICFLIKYKTPKTTGTENQEQPKQNNQ